MIDRRRLMALGAGFALAPVATRPVFAQAWPNRAVRVIVPYAAGGATDVVTRIVADWLSRKWASRRSWRTSPAPALTSPPPWSPAPIPTAT
ncbi:MAG: hypothetical protein JO328_07620 [Hyphomicrobiales bacterium]|nr:hypothetical protein [Hyphomicrobiales bacterium]